MWFTEGVDDLEVVDLLLDLWGATVSPIGFATYTYSAGGGFGGGGAAPPPEGTTDLQAEVNDEGFFIVDVTCSSYDDLVEAFIAEDTRGLDEHGKPLAEIAILKMTDPPDPPPDNTIIGVVYDFRPDGATFDPPITVTFKYDPDLIPDIVDEEDLVVAMWDEDTETWVHLTSVVNPDDNTITVQIAHFTGFTVMASHVPATFRLSDLMLSPSEVDSGDTIHVEVTLSNIGGLSGVYKLELNIDGTVAAVKSSVLDGGDSATIYFFVHRDTPGSHTVSVEGLSGTFTINDSGGLPVSTEPVEYDTRTVTVTPIDVAGGESIAVRVLITNTSNE